MPTATRRRPAITHTFADDGRIPNNPRLPLVLYRDAIDLSGTSDPEVLVEQTFAANGWGGLWRNGIYPYLHYHSMIHEVMGIARGRATVRFGGYSGRDITAGHQCLNHSPDLLVIGAYPPAGRFDLCRGSKAEHAKAIAAIPQVPPPAADPVFGPKGPLTALWRA